MEKIKIFCYKFSPRVFKSTITARYAGTAIEYIGSENTTSLKDWLWDYNPRVLSEQQKRELPQFATKARTGFTDTIFKTNEFLKLHPFGMVPAGFAKNGKVGIFESNSIMRAVSRAGEKAHMLYGTDIFESSRIDSFLDQSLIFAISSQKYHLSLLNNRDNVDNDAHRQAETAMRTYLSGIENALTAFAKATFIMGETLTLIDIAYACELCMFAGEKPAIQKLKSAEKAPVFSTINDFPECLKLLHRLSEKPNFAKDLTDHYRALCYILDCI